MTAQYFREKLTLALIAILPFHALLVTIGTKFIEGPGHAPITFLALWKEALLGVIVCLCVIEWIRELMSGKWKVESGKWFEADLLDALIAALITLSLVLLIFHFPFSIFHYLLGFKYDFLPLVAFLILRRVSWSETFLERVLKILIGVGVIVAGYGLISFFLPQGFFTALGYSDLHSLYLPNAPLAAFQQIEALDLRRIQSTMSGPNQLGLWLLIPWSAAIMTVLHRREKMIRIAGILMMLAIALTFSRSAWVAGAVITGIALFWKFRRGRWQIALPAVAGAAIIAAFGVFAFVPDVVLRLQSSSNHIARPLVAIRTMIEHPFGLGLGMAGPASNRVSDACVFLEAGSDSSWAQDRPDLCVFVGDIQVQPPDPCDCPLLPENWYLQIGVELGILGFILYVVLIVMILLKLRENEKSLSIFLAFLGISIASIFLHAWEDAAVAYTLWVLAGVALGTQSVRTMRQ